MFDYLNFSTEIFNPSERFGRYNDLYSAGADSVAIDDTVSAAITGRRLPGLIIYDRRLFGLGTERSAERVRRNQFDHFTLQLNLAGELHGDAADGYRRTAPGEILFMDMAKPMRSRMPDLHVITVGVPRNLIEAASTSVDKMHGLLMPRKVAQPLADLLLRLLEAPREDRPWTERALLHHLASAFGKMGLSTAKSPLDDERPDQGADVRQSPFGG